MAKRKKRKKQRIKTPAVEATKNSSVRYYQLFLSLLRKLNNKLFTSPALNKAIDDFNSALNRGRYIAPAAIQRAFATATKKGAKVAAKEAPIIVDKVFPPEAMHNDLSWQRSMIKQGGQEFSVRIMEKTRVNAIRNMTERMDQNKELMGNWTSDHYNNMQNALNEAIRIAENGGPAVNMRKIASRSIVEGKVPPNAKVANRARLIARDQMSKFNASVNRGRAADLKSEFYQWRSVRDNRVRDHHREWNGHYFTKAGKEVTAQGKPVPGGINTGGLQPGDEVNCRCSAAWQLFI